MQTLTVFKRLKIKSLTNQLDPCVQHVCILAEKDKPESCAIIVDKRVLTKDLQWDNNNGYKTLRRIKDSIYVQEIFSIRLSTLNVIIHEVNKLIDPDYDKKLTK